MDRVDTSGRALVQHWKWAAEKGLMNPNTANALRAACGKVLAVEDGWENLDIRTIDVDGLCRRFQTRNSKDYKPESLDTYKRRFVNAVEMFLKHTDDPASWRPHGQDIAGRRERNARTNGSYAVAATSGSVTPASVPVKGLVDYPFPLREDRFAYLRLPVDLKMAEVKRLTAYLATLAVDFEPMADSSR